MLTSLLVLREELTRGDLRPLYIGWLSGLEADEVGMEAKEPPRPPGLSRLTPAQAALAQWLRVSEDLLAAAGEGEQGQGPTPASRETERMRAWVESLPDAERVAWLVRLAEESASVVQGQLWASCRRGTRRERALSDLPRRRVSQLLARASDLEEVRLRREAEEAARRREAAARRQAEARERRLETLAGREARAWRDAERIVEEKQNACYAEAVQQLADLVELGRRQGREATARQRVEEVRRRQSRKSSFVKLLKNAGLAV